MHTNSNCQQRIGPSVLHLIQPLIVAAVLQINGATVFAQATNQNAISRSAPGAAPANTNDESWEKALQVLRLKMAELDKTNAVASPLVASSQAVTNTAPTGT